MKKTNYYSWILIILLVIGISCGKSKNTASEATNITSTPASVVAEATADAGSAAEASSPSTSLNGNVSVGDANGVNEPKKQYEDEKLKMKEKIIRTGNIRIEVENYKESIVDVRKAVDKWGAMITNENEVNDHTRISNDMVIRINSTRFDKFIEELSGMKGRFETKQITAEDVTEEWFDIETRIATKRKVLDRYAGILKQASKIDDILQVEEKMRIIQEEIEQAEGRLKFIKDRVSYSTINLGIYQNIEYKYEPLQNNGFFTRCWKGIITGWKGIVGIIVGLTYIWPFLLIAIIVLIWYFKRKKKETQNI